MKDRNEEGKFFCLCLLGVREEGICVVISTVNSKYLFGFERFSGIFQHLSTLYNPSVSATSTLD